ncbi:hypothetical protein SAMN05444166_3137 [Singulisphaera sp. GP187]|uniref:hypothetical protein n=1 Tax=Singulisphaera sp. GP187 TaxID=1882752 RepID=UPI00092A20C5|nr:hypothetical protein [Singulisphaera sp. GP187]SIO23324.1 hypothetical protein SAMN05444166_3137 [Singulisphaera sp. GP187]
MATIQSDLPFNPSPGDVGSRGSGLELLRAVVLGAMAGGLGWGIRGQYGHETGAMIAGVLIGFVLVLLFIPRATSLQGARAVALTAVGIAFGGSMTYGQTVGLTHNPFFVGNWAALRWGMLGLFLKGGIWFGFAGAFLGIGLSGKRWRPCEMLRLLVAMMGLILVGVRVLNRPFDPAHRILPPLYFSFDWYWQPNAGAELKPRPEVWGGLLFALAGLTAYAQWVRRDRLARNLTAVGFLAGGLGFSLGQCIQAFHGWNREMFQSGVLQTVETYTNWWNMMETTFGAIGGGGLALGLWWNRRLILEEASGDQVSISPPWEFVMVAAHLILLVGAEFHLIPGLDYFLAFGPCMAVVALPGIVGGRYWPSLFALPIVAVPIAGKTLLALSYKEQVVSRPLGWGLLVALPLGLTLWVAFWLVRRGRAGQSAARSAATGLLLTTWLYFALNFAFFRWPWPWAEWTMRTPNALIFAVCAVGLTTAAVALRSSGDGGQAEESPGESPTGVPPG